MGKTREDFDASLVILKANIELFHSGVRETYRVIATELRKQTCDKKSLIPRIFKELRLHMLHWTGMLRDCPSLADGLELLIPGRISRSPSGFVRFELMFHQSQTRMELDAWLDQPILSPAISVRELIRSVANKEGAHSDPEYNETLLRAKCVKFDKDDSHIHSIIAIAEYILAFIGKEPLELNEEARS